MIPPLMKQLSAFRRRERALRNICEPRQLLVIVGMMAYSATGLLGAESSTSIEFNLAGGDADVALRQFADQSGQQVIYPTDLAQGVKVPPLKGRFTPKEALDHLLAGSGITAWEDSATGALALGRLGLSQRLPPLQLPPFLVTEKVDAPKWRYVGTPQFEVLSRCDDSGTTNLIAQHVMLHQVLDMILPEQLQFRSDIPTTYLFFNESGAAAISNELLSTLQQRAVKIAADADPKETKPSLELALNVLPNYRFWDQDTLSIFFLSSDSGYGARGGRLTLTPSYVRYLLERRTPSLPRWFIDGMNSLYQHTTLVVPSWVGSYSTGNMDIDLITIHPQVWVSADATQEMLKRSRMHVKMLPLDELFSNRAKANSGRNETDENLRQSQAELFIRWIFDQKSESRRRALWKFAERASRAPVDEALFKECFGLDYHHAESELQAYVHAACTKQIVLRPSAMPAVTALSLRDATEAEVSRIKGRFNRLEIPYVRQFSAALTEKYVAQARRTLRYSYDHGDRDPQLLAELGLCECDAGNDRGAAPFLEAATEARVVRPRAYYELARIRFTAAQPSGSVDKLSAAELTSILKPLFLMRGQTPALGEAYELMAEAWLSTDARPTVEQLDVLEEGLKFFPRGIRLIFSIALVNAGQGRLAEAQRFIDLGLSLSSDPKEITRFRNLQALIEANRPAQKK